MCEHTHTHKYIIMLCSLDDKNTQYNMKYYVG